MNTKGKISAILLSAGKGLRMGSNLSKQFLEIDNKPIIAHTLEKFEFNKNIDNIILVLGEDQEKYFVENISTKYKYKKLTNIVMGGKTRQESVYNALINLDKFCDIVLIHDGVRPFIEDKYINKVIEKTKEKEACVLGVNVKDTIKYINRENIIIETLDRENTKIIQTPQGFKYNTILKAHINAINKNIIATDDASLLELMGQDVYIEEGDYKNIKVTTLEDLEFCEFIIRKRSFK